MATKEGITSFYLGGKKIGEAKTQSLKLPETEPEKTTARMQFYYRRGNRHFFKTTWRKLMIESPDLTGKLKKGDYYDAEWSA